MTNTATPIAITFRRLTSTGAPSTDGGGLGSGMVPTPCPSTRVPSIHQPSWSRWERPTTIELRSPNAQHALKLFLRGYESGAPSDTGRSNGSGWTSAPGADSPDEQEGTHNRRPCWTLACTAIAWSPSHSEAKAFSSQCSCRSPTKFGWGAIKILRSLVLIVVICGVSVVPLLVSPTARADM